MSRLWECESAVADIRRKYCAEVSEDRLLRALVGLLERV